MEKRGIGHHLDWIIGISLFILYILFVIVTLKPGVQPLQKGSTLVDIVQDRFIQNVTWNITKLELNIKSAGCSGSIIYCSLPFPFSYDNPHTKVYNEADNSDADFSISGSTLYVQSCYPVDGLGTAFVPGKFKIIYSDEIVGAGSGSPSGTFCTNPTYTFGIPELITGLSEDKIQALADAATTDYEQLKKDLNYPLTNDFIIEIDKDGSITAINEKIAPPSNANVYVRQFPEFILDESGERTPVILRIKVW